MNTYGWLLVGQTLLAILALGFAGWWMLRPFQRADRPFLWLSAPLAGLFGFGGALAVLYFGLRLPFRWCLWIGFGLNVTATIVCWVRARPQLPPLRHRLVATVVILAAVYWSTTSANKTSIEAREPTVAIQDGSDMYGYAIVADWLRAHPASERPRPSEVFEILVHVNLYVDGSRPVTFLLTATAAEVRGTRALFSYDWLCGVVLGCAVLGFAGLFATSPFTLVALTAGAALSSWLTVARSGFLGKTVAYPGGLLLAGLVLATVTDFTWRRAGVVAWLGAVVAYSVNPIFPAMILTLVVGGYLGAVTVFFAFARWNDRTTSFRTGLTRPLRTAVLVYAVAALPTFIVHRIVYHGGVPATPANWSFVIPVALDLDLPTVQLVSQKTQTWLLAGCAVLLAVALAVALRWRERVAVALLATALVVPASRLLGLHQLHLLHGLLYPFSLAGAAVLAGALVTRQRRWQAAAVVLVMIGMVGLRVPQSRAATDRYVGSGNPQRVTISRSESDAIRTIVGTDSVDVWMAQWPDNCYVVTDLAPYGIDVHLRSPAWERSLKNWARNRCPTPDLLAPKSRFTILERDTYAPPETVRYTGRRYKLCEDSGSITLVSIIDAQLMGADAKWRPMCWIGNAPTTFLIHNGTGRPQPVLLCGQTSAGPAHPDREHRTLTYLLGEQTGTVAVPGENTVAIPLHLEPGLNRVELSVVETPNPEPQKNQPVLLLALYNWRFESARALSRAEQR
jgi:hypothetical protein